MQKLNTGGKVAATETNIKSILGAMDTDKLLEIVSLHPTIAEVEEAAMWLSGDADIFGANAPVKGTVSRIVTILTTDEEEERR